MGYVKESHTLPCRCGKGTLVGEWKEHDRWPSDNRTITWRFECESCSAEFDVHHGLLDDRYVVKRADGQALRSLQGGLGGSKSTS